MQSPRAGIPMNSSADPKSGGPSSSPKILMPMGAATTERATLSTSRGPGEEPSTTTHPSSSSSRELLLVGMKFPKRNRSVNSRKSSEIIGRSCKNMTKVIWSPVRLAVVASSIPTVSTNTKKYARKCSKASVKSSTHKLNA